MGLYIHVPFCGSICSYCHFARTALSGLDNRQRYVENVLTELELRSGHCSILGDRSRPLTTAYLGGGTPSLLEDTLIKRLIDGTIGTFDLAPDFELSIEANPESITLELADVWLELGIGRVSLGIQSLRDDVLRMLGRSCDSAKARWALQLACRVFPRVSADWILGPGLAVDSFLDEIKEAADLGVEHFSLYILEVHTGTRMSDDVKQGRLALPSDIQIEKLYLAAGDCLEQMGFTQYEVANFARPGAESRHNQNYWSGQPYLGLGPGAHGFWGHRRYANFSDIGRWTDEVVSGRIPEEEVDPLDRRARHLERVILSLRTLRGVPLAWLPPGALDLEKGIAQGWWEVADQHLILTRSGFLRINGFEAALANKILV